MIIKPYGGMSTATSRLPIAAYSAYGEAPT